MRKLLLMLVATLFAVGMASAATVNCDGTGDWVNGGAAVTPDLTVICGPLTFTGFNLYAQVPAGSVFPMTLVAPGPNSYTGFVNGVASLMFNPALSTGQDENFTFNVAGAGIVAVDGWFVGTGGADIQEQVCVLGSQCPGSGAIIPTFNLTGTNQTFDLGGTYSGLTIWKDIKGPTSFFVQSFHVVPEPMTFVLLGSGLLGIGLLRRRKA